MTFGKSLNYQRYWTPSWKVFIWLSLATAVPMFFVVAMVRANNCRGCPPPYIVDLALMALLVAAPFTILGLITGLIRNWNAKELVGKAVGASYLDSSHALTKQVHRLSDQLQLPRPAVGIMSATNAFAVGRTPDDAAVIIGRPLLNRLSPEELDAVIGHELGHIASGDMNRMQLATGFQLAFEWFFMVVGFLFAFVLIVAAKSNSRHAGTAQLGASLSRLCAILAQVTIAIGSSICIYALSRRREYFADAVGAMLTTPETMRRALRTIHQIGAEPLAGESEYRMLMFRGWAGGLFSTHPTLDSRLDALDAGEFVSRVKRSFRGERFDWSAIEISESAKLFGMSVIVALMAFVVVWKLLPF
jgi:heat shock protein HtpX